MCVKSARIFVKYPLMIKTPDRSKYLDLFCIQSWIKFPKVHEIYRWYTQNKKKTDKVSPKASSFNVCFTLLFEWTSRLHYQVPPVAGSACKLEECFI